MPTIAIFDHDLPDVEFGYFMRQSILGVDTETTGLFPWKDKLAMVQICDEAGEKVALVRRPNKYSINLIQLLRSPLSLKVFHYARFDLAFLSAHVETYVSQVFCTQTLALVMGVHESTSLAYLAKKYLQVDLDKSLRVAGFPLVGELSREQIEYAAMDVLVLPALRERLLSLSLPEHVASVSLAMDVINQVAQLDVMTRGVVFSGSKSAQSVTSSCNLEEKFHLEKEF